MSQVTFTLGPWAADPSSGLVVTWSPLTSLLATGGLPILAIRVEVAPPQRPPSANAVRLAAVPPTRESSESSESPCLAQGGGGGGGGPSIRWCPWGGGQCVGGVVPRALSFSVFLFASGLLVSPSLAHSLPPSLPPSFSPPLPLSLPSSLPSSLPPSLLLPPSPTSLPLSLPPLPPHPFSPSLSPPPFLSFTLALALFHTRARQARWVGLWGRGWV